MKTQTVTTAQAIKDGNSVANQDIKSKFIQREVYCNVGSLVEYIIGKGFEDSNAPFTLDDIENYYSYPEYYGKYADFGGGTEAQRDEEVQRLLAMFEPGEPKEEDAEIQQEIDTLDTLESEPAEVFEWWAVSEYLYRKLKEQGYCVVDAGSCYIWGRTTTGQAILLDGVISRICAEMKILQGQTNDWSK